MAGRLKCRRRGQSANTSAGLLRAVRTAIDGAINAYDRRLRKELEKKQEERGMFRNGKQAFIRELLSRRLADVELGEVRFALSQIRAGNHVPNETLGAILDPQPQQSEQREQRGQSA